MTNILYIGPRIGIIIKKLSTNSREGDRASDFWRFTGRCTSGIISTFISQPFDVVARQQQLLADKG
jgi:hypothetical protein